MTVKRLQRLSTEHGARQLLERLVATGRCTIEDLDLAPPGHVNPSIYRNLMRDPEQTVEPKVQVTDPRDFQAEPDENPLPY
jgi:hypothetical protein